MATRFHMRSAGVQFAPSGTAAFYNVYDASRAPTPGDSAVSGNTNSQSLDDAGAGTSPTSSNISTVAGATAGRLLVSETNPYLFFSLPFNADVTISGTVSFSVWAFESSMSANATVRVAVYRIDEFGLPTLIVNSTFGTELGTTPLAQKTWTASPTSTLVKRGHRLLAFVLIDDATATTMASGFTSTIGWGGAAGVQDTYVEFTETITTFGEVDVGYSQDYFLRDTASDLGGIYKALSQTAGSGTATATHTIVVGPQTWPGDLWTASAGGADIQWITPQLVGFTLAFPVYIRACGGTAFGDNGANLDTTIFELTVTDSDGTNPVRLATTYHHAVITPPAAADLYFLAPDKVITTGQRLRFAAYQDDFRPNNAVAGTNRILRYDGSLTYRFNLSFRDVITELSGNTPQLQGVIR